MATLEEILKSKGYTDADLEALKPTLSEPKLRLALESTIGEYETKVSAAETKLNEYDTWYQTQATPTLDKALKDAQDARAEAASHREKLRVLQEQGLTRLAEDAGEKPEAKPVATQEQFDPKKYNLITRDDVIAFADQEGEAIALAQDLAAEHRELFGSKLNFRELRKLAKEAKQPVEQFWMSRYNVQAKRDELAAKDRAEAEAKIRADERAKTIAEVANPMARSPVSSSNPFTRKTGTEGGAERQPWENAEERSINRVNKALRTVLQ